METRQHGHIQGSGQAQLESPPLKTAAIIFKPLKYLSLLAEMWGNGAQEDKKKYLCSPTPAFFFPTLAVRMPEVYKQRQTGLKV